MLKLTAAATVSIPRIVIFALTIVYGLAGLFGRDPWKNEDSIGFGVMWTLHTGPYVRSTSPQTQSSPHSSRGRDQKDQLDHKQWLAQRSQCVEWRRWRLQ